MHVLHLRSPHAKVGGIVYFGRMLDNTRPSSAGLEQENYADGFGGRADIRTWFELFDADEAAPARRTKRTR